MKTKILVYIKSLIFHFTRIFQAEFVKIFDSYFKLINFYCSHYKYIYVLLQVALLLKNKKNIHIKNKIY